MNSDQDSENSASIIAIGDELLSGNTQDLNCSFLAKALSLFGVVVKSISFVGDRQEDIVGALQRAALESPLVITTGGIGPTADDITRNCVAHFSGRQLELRQSCLDKLLEFLRQRGRELTETNKRQAFIPVGAEVIPNDFGTADGIITPFDYREGKANGMVLTLPGVPREMRGLADKALPIVCNQLFNVSLSRCEEVLQIFGVPESDIGAKIESLNLPLDLDVAYRPHFPMVSVEIIGADSDLVKDATQQVVAALGQEFVFAKGRSVTLAAAVGEILKARGLTLATAESCTGGLVAHRIVAEAGSSQFFNGAIVSYSNQAKLDLLGVSAKNLETFGAVSAQVAIEMANGAREKLASDISISVTGIAGPDGGSEEKPVGAVWFGYSDKSESFALNYRFPGNRRNVRELSAAVALDIVRRKIVGISDFYPKLQQKFPN